MPAVNTRPVSNNSCSLFVLIRKRLTWALLLRQRPLRGPHSLPWPGLLSAALLGKSPRLKESFLCISFRCSSCTAGNMESSSLIQRDFGAGSNYSSRLEQAAALIGEVLGYVCVSQRPSQHPPPTAPPRGFPGKLHSPDRLKPLGMGVMTALLSVGRESHPQPSKNGERKPWLL